MDVDPLQAWREFEERYRVRSYRGVGSTNECFRRLGTRGVLITAGHSVAQVRDGLRKRPDVRTGGLAELVALSTGASVLTAIGSGQGDPNLDSEHPFKDALAALTPTHHTVLDLHGMEDRAGVDVWIGAGRAGGRATALATLCAESAADAGLRVKTGHPFAAARSTTLTSTAIALGCRAAQIEIASHARDLDRDQHACERVVRWLVALCETLGATHAASGPGRQLPKV